MKRCAKCDREYADDYDACPYCAKKPKSLALPFWTCMILGGLLFFAPFPIGPIGLLLIVAAGGIFTVAAVRLFREGYNS